MYPIKRHFQQSSIILTPGGLQSGYLFHPISRYTCRFSISPPVYFAIRAVCFPCAGANSSHPLSSYTHRRSRFDTRSNPFDRIYNRIGCRAHCLIILTIFAIIMAGAMIYDAKHQQRNRGKRGAAHHVASS